jgi:histidine triad (HIT) family protein
MVAREIPAEVVHDDDLVLAFRDINPQAPVHVLVIPKRHVVSADDLGETDGDLLGRLFAVIRNVARAEGISERGYRVATNVGDDGGQSVRHLHFHVLGGRRLGWPPG